MKIENEMKNITDKPKVSNKTKRLADLNRQKRMEKEKLYWETYRQIEDNQSPKEQDENNQDNLVDVDQNSNTEKS